MRIVMRNILEQLKINEQQGLDFFTIAEFFQYNDRHYEIKEKLDFLIDEGYVNIQDDVYFITNKGKNVCQIGA